MLSYIVRSVIQMAGRSRVTAAGSQEKDPGWRDTALAGRWTRTAAFNQQHGPLQQGPDVVEMRYCCCVPGTRIWRHLCIIVQGRKKGIPPVGWDGKSPPFFTRKGTETWEPLGRRIWTALLYQKESSQRKQSLCTCTRTTCLSMSQEYHHLQATWHYAVISWNFIEIPHHP